MIKQVDRVPLKFLAPMKGYDGLFEVKVEFESNIYRVFCCFDKGRLVVLFNGFQKNEITKKWTQPIRNWGIILNQFMTIFGNRIK